MSVGAPYALASHHNGMSRSASLTRSSYRCLPYTRVPCLYSECPTPPDVGQESRQAVTALREALPRNWTLPAQDVPLGSPPSVFRSGRQCLQTNRCDLNLKCVGSWVLTSFPL